MNPIIRQDIIAVLKEAKEALAREDAATLKEVSNHTTHNASIFQDEDSVSIAVIMYALSKIIERSGIEPRKIIPLIEEMQKNLETENYGSYKKTVKNAFSFISRIDTKLQLYIEEVANQARIKKGSKLYYHGISLAQAAEVLGISQWELMSYVGKTNITETKQADVKERIKLARGLFQ